jgi:hypothetical protein
MKLEVANPFHRKRTGSRKNRFFYFIVKQKLICDLIYINFCSVLLIFAIPHLKLFCYEKDIPVCHSIAIGALVFLY